MSELPVAWIAKDNRPYLLQKVHLLLCDRVHHPQVVDELLQWGNAVLLEWCWENVELPEITNLNTVPTLLQHFQSVLVDEHPAHWFACCFHTPGLPSENLEKSIGILPDGCPAFGLRLAAREDDDVHVLFTLGCLEQDFYQFTVPMFHLHPLFRVEAQLPSDEGIEDPVVGTLRMVVEDTQHIIATADVVNFRERQSIVLQQLAPLFELFNSLDWQQCIVSLLDFQVLKPFRFLLIVAEKTEIMFL